MSTLVPVVNITSAPLLSFKNKVGEAFNLGNKPIIFICSLKSRSLLITPTFSNSFNFRYVETTRCKVTGEFIDDEYLGELEISSVRPFAYKIDTVIASSDSNDDLDEKHFDIISTRILSVLNRATVLSGVCFTAPLYRYNSGLNMPSYIDILEETTDRLADLKIGFVDVIGQQHPTNYTIEG